MNDKSAPAIQNLPQCILSYIAQKIPDPCALAVTCVAASKAVRDVFHHAPYFRLWLMSAIKHARVTCDATDLWNRSAVFRHRLMMLESDASDHDVDEETKWIMLNLATNVDPIQITVDCFVRAGLRRFVIAALKLASSSSPSHVTTTLPSALIVASQHDHLHIVDALLAEKVPVPMDITTRCLFIAIVRHNSTLIHRALNMMTPHRFIERRHCVRAVICTCATSGLPATDTEHLLEYFAAIRTDQHSLRDDVCVVVYQAISIAAVHGYVDTLRAFVRFVHRHPVMTPLEDVITRAATRAARYDQMECIFELRRSMAPTTKTLSKWNRDVVVKLVAKLGHIGPNVAIWLTGFVTPCRSVLLKTLEELAKAAPTHDARSIVLRYVLQTLHRSRVCAYDNAYHDMLLRVAATFARGGNASAVNVLLDAVENGLVSNNDGAGEGSTSIQPMSWGGLLLQCALAADHATVSRLFHAKSPFRCCVFFKSASTSAHMSSILMSALQMAVLSGHAPTLSLLLDEYRTGNFDFSLRPVLVQALSHGHDACGRLVLQAITGSTDASFQATCSEWIRLLQGGTSLALAMCPREVASEHDTCALHALRGILKRDVRRDTAARFQRVEDKWKEETRRYASNVLLEAFSSTNEQAVRFLLKRIVPPISDVSGDVSDVNVLQVYIHEAIIAGCSDSDRDIACVMALLDWMREHHSYYPASAVCYLASSALAHACHVDRIRTATVLVDLYGANIHGHADVMPLFSAVQGRSVGAVWWLLQRGAKPNDATIIAAADIADPVILYRLLQYGQVSDITRQRCLEIASRRSNQDLLKHLLLQE